jgi:hypothetical protein
MSTAEDAVAGGADSRMGLLFLGDLSDLHCIPKMLKNKQKMVIFCEK